MEEKYDLVIIGGTCIGLAMAYTARKQGLKCLLLEKDTLSSQKKNLQRLGASQNRILGNEAYLTKYLMEANNYWQKIEEEAAEKKYHDCKFFHREGSFWFGDIESGTEIGNILESNQTLEDIKDEKQTYKTKKLYMETLIETYPPPCLNFRFGEGQFKSNEWSALFQPNGGSIDLPNAYEYFKFFATQEKYFPTPVVKVEESVLFDKLSYTKRGLENHSLTICKNKSKGIPIAARKIFVADGVKTGEFVRDVLKGGNALADEGIQIEEVFSYFEIEKGKQDLFSYPNFSPWVQFLKDDQESIASGYGLPYHHWDNPVELHEMKTVKVCTSQHINTDPVQLKESSFQTANEDHKGRNVMYYVSKYMKNVKSYPKKTIVNPKVHIEGRQTVLDFLNRTERDIAIQTGGDIGGYFPFLARSAFKLLFRLDSLTNAEADTVQDIEKTFLNRTSYPLRKAVLQNLDMSQPANNATFDTVIVGAGASGLYSAFRLLQNDATTNQKIGMFDMLDRISGRLWSVQFNGSHTPMELGGMRYIQQSHPLVDHHIKTLHIPSIDFKMKGNLLQSNNRKAYLRNDHYRKDEWSQLQAADQKLRTAYHIDDRLTGMNTNQIISYSIYLIFWADYNENARMELNKKRKSDDYCQKHLFQKKNAGSEWIYHICEFDLEDWNLIKPLLLFKPSSDTKEAIPLYKFGFQNVIQSQFSHETYLFINDEGGYYSLTFNNSYIEHVMGYLIDFGDVHYKTLSGGYDMICYNLANHILTGPKSIARKKGGIYLEQELVNIQQGSAGYKYKLTFRKTGSEQEQPPKIDVYANKIIMGVTRRSSEILYAKIKRLQKPLTNYHVNNKIQNLKSAVRPKKFNQLLASTMNMPSMKIIMNFHKNWWDIGHTKEYLTASQMRGVSVTDLPIRQCLYFGTAKDNFLLASYNDMVTTSYWDVLQTSFDEKFIPTSAHMKQETSKKQKIEQLSHIKSEKDYNKYFKLKKPKDNKYIAQASVEVVKEVIKQLSLLHGKKVTIDMVKEAMYQNWTKDPFGGGYHNWQSGYDIEACMKAMRRPWKEEDIFFVGEAYSCLPGWVEGAFQTAEQMLIKEYGLPPTIEGLYLGY